MIDIDVVKAQNTAITGHGDIISDHMLESAFSSWYYYESPEEQICSIYRGLIKNHAFRDGNKRTACIVLLTLCEQCNILLACSDIELGNLTIDIAENNYEVKEIVDIVFNPRIEEIKMTIFQTLLTEALDDKPFSTIGDLKDAIKTVLNSHSRLSKEDSLEFTKIGFKFKTYKREFRIKVTGDDSHVLIADLKKAKIHCRYSSINDTITIRYEDNVSSSGLLSQEAQDEIEKGTYGLIGYVTADKDYPDFFREQQSIYNELYKYKLVDWIQNKDNQYILKLV